jgi:tetratricopeptide (TPR) repeat protein
MMRRVTSLLVTSLLVTGLAHSKDARANPRQNIERQYVALLKSGEQLVKNGALQAAIKVFGRAIAKKPADARAYYQRGVCHARIKKSRLALADYRAALKRDPKMAMAHNNLGALLHEIRQHEAAGKHLRQAVRYKAAYAEAWFNLGLVLAAQRKFRDAAKAYRRAARLRPRDVDVHINLGGVLQRLRDVKGAVTQLAMAVRLKPSDALARCGYGELLLLSGKTKEGITQLKVATRLDAAYPRPWRALARAHVKAKRLKRAESVLLSGLRANPTSGALLAALGQVYRLQKKGGPALAAYRKALKLGYPRAHLLIGLHHAQRGDCKNAKRSFLRYLKSRQTLPAGALGKLMRRCKKRR